MTVLELRENRAKRSNELSWGRRLSAIEGGKWSNHQPRKKSYRGARFLVGKKGNSALWLG